MVCGCELLRQALYFIYTVIAADSSLSSFTSWMVLLCVSLFVSPFAVNFKIQVNGDSK